VDVEGEADFGVVGRKEALVSPCPLEEPEVEEELLVEVEEGD
jgi:hypothetical protein